MHWIAPYEQGSVAIGDLATVVTRKNNTQTTNSTRDYKELNHGSTH